MNLKDFSEPFPESDIEWRIHQSGKSQSGEIWAIALAYVTNRAIMERLDEVCGQENWRNEYKTGPDGGVLCGISIRCKTNGNIDEWVTKWDGAQNTEFESVKGGLSGAMKRAAVQWGIGRYLYNLEASFAKIVKNGRFRDRLKDKTPFSWNPPELPAWALPCGIQKVEEKIDHTVGKRTGADPELFNRTRDGLLKLGVPAEDVDMVLENWRTEYHGNARDMYDAAMRLYNDGKHYVNGEWVMK